jgi:hypothetical protein
MGQVVLGNDEILTSLDSMVFRGAAVHIITAHRNTNRTGDAMLYAAHCVRFTRRLTGARVD